MQYTRSQDWVRAHRELLAAERQFTELLDAFGRREVSREQLAEAKQLVEAKRALADAVTEMVLGPGTQRCDNRAASAPVGAASNPGNAA